MVRTALVLVHLPSPDCVISFFHALLSLLSTVHNERVEYYVLDILSSVLAEFNIDEVPMQLVDAVLSYLTPQQLQSNPRAAAVVTRLLDKHRDKLERAVCKWVSDTIIHPAMRADKKKSGGKGGKGGEESDEESRMEEDDEEVFDSCVTNRSEQLTVFQELHLEVPAILASLHADLQALLTVDIEQTRKQFTAVYADIFSTKPATIRHMPITYELLLARFNDVNAHVRLVIAEKAEALLIKVYGQGRSHLIGDDDDEQAARREEKEDGVTSGISLGLLPHSEATSLQAMQQHLQVALQDRDDNVRQASMHSLSRATMHSPALVNLQLLSLMGARCHDRRHEVRKEAIVCLADIFHHHLTPHWRKGSPVPSAHRKFSFIPRTLLTACPVDASNSLFVEMALDSKLIGLKEKELTAVDERTTCLLAIFSTLEEVARREVEKLGVQQQQQREEDTAKAMFVKKFIVDKASLQRAVQGCIQMQQQIVSATQRGDDVQRLQQTRLARVRALAHSLMFDDDPQYFTQAGAGALAAAKEEAQRYITDVLLGLFAHDEPKVTEHLQTLTDCRASLRDIRQAHEAVVKLVDKKGVKMGGKKREKGPTATHITNRLACFCSQAVLPIDSVPHLFTVVQSSSGPTSIAALDLLNAVAESWPLMLASSVDSLYSLMQQQDDEAKLVAALRILSSIDFSAASPKHSLTNKLDTALRTLATTSANPDVTRYAIRAIKAVFTEHTGGLMKTTHRLKVNVDLHEDAREDKADAILHALFSHYIDRLDLTQRHLDAVLVGIGEVSSFYPRLFYVHRDAIVSFVFKQLFISPVSVYHSAVLKGIECIASFMGGLALTESVEATTVGRQLMGFYIRAIVNKGVLNLTAVSSGPSTPASNRSRTAEADGEDHEMKADDGEEDDELLSVKEERQQRVDDVLLTLAKSLIDVCTHSAYHRILVHVPNTATTTPAALKKSYHFGHLAYLAQSSSDRVRAAFVDHVLVQLQSSRLPFSPYAVILAIAAPTVDEQPDARAKLKKQLTNLVQRQRQRAMTLETVREAVKEDDTTGGGRGGGGKKRVNPQLPENVLADLIYLLSYHPHFVDPLDTLLPHQVTEAVLQASFAMYNSFLATLDFFLDCLTSDKAEGHYSLLLAICATIKNCEDVRDPHNTNLYKLADLVQLSVHHRSLHKDWKITISASVSLPAALYKARDTPPKERYLHSDYKLPQHKGDKEKPVGGAGPSTPKKRKGPEVAHTPQSSATASSHATGGKGGKTPASGREKKAKVVKEAATPSRQMPARSVKSQVSTYDESMHDAEEEDDDQLIPLRTPPRSSTADRTGGAAQRPPSSARGEKGKENEERSINGRRLQLGNARPEARAAPRQGKAVEEGEEDGDEGEDQQEVEADEEEEDGDEDEEEAEEDGGLRSPPSKPSAQRAVRQPAAAATRPTRASRK